MQDPNDITSETLSFPRCLKACPSVKFYQSNHNVHSGEIQIHADSKGKVALDDIMLLANPYTKCRGNTISRFSALCKR